LAVGPEGGFTPDELELFYGANNFPFQDLTAIVKKVWTVGFHRQGTHPLAVLDAPELLRSLLRHAPLAARDDDIRRKVRVSVKAYPAESRGRAGPHAP